MDRTTLRQLFPHYVILVVLISVILVAIRMVAPDFNIWYQSAIAILVGTVYPPLLRYLDRAPEPWQ